jgi:Bacterial type II and III secretion system protein
MRTVVFAFFVLASCSVALSQDAPTPRPYGAAVPHAAGAGFGAPPVPRPLPAIPTPAASQPAARPACPKPVPATLPTATIRLEHLLEAAVHLEAAGETQQGQQVRGLVAQERRALLDRLHKGKPEPDVAQVLLHLRVIEVSRSKLAKLGFEWTSIQNEDVISSPFGRVSPTTFQVVDDNKGLRGMLEALRKAKLVRVLAEPTLVAMSGQPAHFQCGGEIPVAGAGGEAGGCEWPTKAGTRVDLVPLVTESDRIRLEMKVAVVEPLADGPAVSGKQQASALKTLNIDTGVEMSSGQTVVMSGFSTYSRDRDETLETLILITSEIVDVPLAAQANPPVNAQR